MVRSCSGGKGNSIEGIESAKGSPLLRSVEAQGDRGRQHDALADPVALLAAVADDLARLAHVTQFLGQL
jgi:hypothetical protein